MTVEKRKRVSKKRKIAWRKHSKIKDVEDFLEEQGFEERIGNIIEQKSDKELFHLDTNTTEPAILSKKEKRKILTEKPLRSFSAFQQPVYLNLKSNTKRDIISKRLQKRLKMKAKETLKPSEVQSLKDTKIAMEKKKQQAMEDKYNADLWITEDSREPELQSEWVSNSTRQNILRGESKFRKILPKITRWKQTILPSVEPPHPGMSYNPSFEDHQALLKEIADKEQKIIKEEQHLNRVTNKMFRKITRERNQENWIEEMSQGLPHAQKEDNSDSEVDTSGPISVNPPVVNKKKDLKQRRKQKEQQKLRHALKLAKIERRKVADIYKLKQIKTKLVKNEEKLETLQQKRTVKKKEMIHKPKRVGPKKYEEPDLEFTEIKDLTGNLRTLKKEGNLLMDRLKSLQKRNIVEPTARRTKKKAKVKQFIKPGHKDDWKVTVAKAKLQPRPLLRNKKIISGDSF
ncbi:ribosome biogenesis protein NOP53 [Agrilus planipennis]|uniref:Ribosome biogenesis protein NOP53 n=1 Tax=Agrilus planipennis TaxID=224129 RepID=A0A1W4X7A1_AGRPL|nr:ribosome biogenesis protein NOP53 [Agrilus planipennis]XP_018328274.1 ribosome biogenesis protein NOP53 [Agrilus planipennis]